MELPDQDNKFPDIIKKVRRGKAPLKEKALKDFYDVAEMITVKHKIQSWNLPILLILLSHRLELSLSGWII
jgi:hypothetical protein